MSRLLLTHARVVFAQEVRDDVAILIDNGVITAIDPEAVGNTRTLDLCGHLLIPGMIDLHCDALEKEVEPRPGVHFPLDFACAQADKRNAMAGITTVFHALSFANHELGVRNNGFAAEIARAVHAWQAHALVDNRVHVRYEVTDETAPAVLSELLSTAMRTCCLSWTTARGKASFRMWLLTALTWPALTKRLMPSSTSC
jgi:alpha-D-ribose 1-methylphosphonate 5-triphosphate diphosphatase